MKKQLDMRSDRYYNCINWQSIARQEDSAKKAKGMVVNYVIENL